MKYSQFNSLIPYKNRFLFYNSFSKKIILINSQLIEAVNQAKTDVSLLKNNHPSLYHAAVKGGFWIDNNIDEIEQIRKKIIAESNNYHQFLLTINPTMNCNFKCWYCYEDHVRGSKINKKNLDSIKKLIGNIIIDNEKLSFFSLGFFGGEPLLYFHDICVPIIDEWKKITEEYNLKRGLYFTTNGYLINDSVFEKLMEYKHCIDSIYMTLDGHRYNHNKVRFVSSTKGSYDTILNNIIRLTNAQINVRVRINYTMDKLTDCSDILKDLNSIKPENKKLLSVSFHCVWQTITNLKDRENEVFEQMNLFHQAGFSVYSPNHLTSNIPLCYGDKVNSAIINYNGDVFKCTARKFDTNKREGYLDEDGHILWNEDKINKRMNSFLRNKPCLSCRLLPHCLGGCTQNQLERKGLEKGYCLNDFNEQKKDELIKDSIQRLLEINKKEKTESMFI